MKPEEKKKEFRRIRKSIQRQVKDDRQKKKAETEIDRAEYIDEIQSFRDEFHKEAIEKGVKDVMVRYFGAKYTSLKDIVYIRYTITDKTFEKTENVLTYIRKLMNKTGLSNYFDPNALKVTNENGEKGEHVHIMILRQDHKWEQLESDPIDVIGMEDEEEGDDMGF
jgi:hypothetical protein